MIATAIYMLGGKALWFVLAPTLLIYGFMNWDLFAVALATGALVAFARRRDGLAGVLLGLGAAAKFYPALLLLPLIAHRLLQAANRTARSRSAGRPSARGSS